MKLYYSPGACSLAPHIVLNEIGADYSLEKVDLGAKKTDSGADFYEVNSKGYVPTLEIAKNEFLTEVSTILQYLADKAEHLKLLPKFGGIERYRAMESLNYVASELHKSIGGLFAKGMPDDGKKVIVERIEKRLDWLEKDLAKKPYLLGADYSVADAYAFTVINWCQHLGIDTKRWPKIQAFMERVGKRPAVQAAMKKEGLIPA